MPPKERITKNEIIEKAFLMTKQNGYESVSARRLAAELGCSTQPIFRIYANMDGLKQDLYIKTREYFNDYIMNRAMPDTPPFLSMGLAYIELAKKESNLFRMLSMSGNFKLQSMSEMVDDKEHPFVTEGVPGVSKIDKDKINDTFMKTWIFTHGIASMIATNEIELSEIEVRKLITEAYIAFIK